MLKMFFDLGDKHLTLVEAKQWDQRPFRSMLIRGYIRYQVNRGFTITKEGKQALREFITTDIARKDPTKPLTKYFDPNAYKLKAVKSA
jgi:hypothetical protein